MKKLIFILLISLCTISAHSQTQISLDQAVNNGHKYLSERFPKGTRASVIFVKADNPELGEFVLKKIGEVMVNNGWFTVVERNQAALDTITREMNYQMSGNVSESTELSIGKQLGAEIIITGELSHSGQNWRLDLKALRIETAQIGGQWSAANIRSDASWGSVTQKAAISFSGDALSERDRQSIIASLRTGLQTTATPLELDEQALSAYAITISIYKDTTSMDLIQAEITLGLTRNGRVVFNAQPYIITETNNTQLIRRIAERIKGDQSFFVRVNEALSNMQ